MYGLKGRVISAIAVIAGVLSAFVAAAQQANLFSLLPQRYLWIATALPILALFFAGFSERIQGGASIQQVRIDAANADKADR